MQLGRFCFPFQSKIYQLTQSLVPQPSATSQGGLRLGQDRDRQTLAACCSTTRAIVAFATGAKSRTDGILAASIALAHLIRLLRKAAQLCHQASLIGGKSPCETKCGWTHMAQLAHLEIAVPKF